MNIYSLTGNIGLIVIIAGMLENNRIKQNIYYTIGGSFMCAYSYFIGDINFIILQLLFIAASLYDMWRIIK